MSNDPFADALNADLDADLDNSSDSDAGLRMKGVAPRLDASDTHNVVSLDDLSVEDVHTAKLGVLSLPTAEAAESEAGTHTNNKVTSASKKKRKRELSAIRSKCAKMHKRGCTPGAMIKMKKVNQTNGADVKCVFLHGKKGTDEQLAIPLLPQFAAQWRDADFGQRSWLVVSTQSRWMQLLIKTQLRNNPTLSDSRTACAHLCAVVKLEFDACLHTQRCVLRAKTMLGKDNTERQPRDEVESGDESSGDKEDVSQETAAEKAQELERHTFRVDRGLTACLQVDIGGYPVMCINTKKHVAFAVDTNLVTFISRWLVPLAQKSARSLYLDPFASRNKMFPLEKSASKEQEDSQTSDASSGFTFIQTMTPDIKDKVCWIPLAHSWKVNALSQIGDRPVLRMFVVDDGLKGKKFLTMKADQYLLAVTEWNVCDKSRRHRIAIPSLLREQIKRTGPQPSSPASGSQPSEASLEVEFDSAS